MTDDEQLIAVHRLAEAEPLTDVRRRQLRPEGPIDQLLRTYFAATSNEALERWYRRRVPSRSTSSRRR
jgi:hypothetical protein